LANNLSNREIFSFCSGEGSGGMPCDERNQVFDLSQVLAPRGWTAYNLSDGLLHGLDLGVHSAKLGRVTGLSIPTGLDRFHCSITA
jgi:hypothetical protein